MQPTVTCRDHHTVTHLPSLLKITMTTVKVGDTLPSGTFSHIPWTPALADKVGWLFSRSGPWVFY